MPNRQARRQARRRTTTWGAAVSVTLGAGLVAVPGASAEPVAESASSAPWLTTSDGSALLTALGGLGGLLDGVLSPVTGALEALLGGTPDDREVTSLATWLEDLDEDEQDLVAAALDDLADGDDPADVAETLADGVDDDALAELTDDDGPLAELLDEDPTGLLTELIAQLRALLEADPDDTGGAADEDAEDAPESSEPATGTPDRGGSDDDQGPAATEGAEGPSSDPETGAPPRATETDTAPAEDDVTAQGDEGTSPGSADAPDLSMDRADAPGLSTDLGDDLEGLLDTSVVRPDALEPFVAEEDGGAAPEDQARAVPDQFDGLPGDSATGQPTPPQATGPEAERDQTPVTAATATTAGEARTGPLVVAGAALLLSTLLVAWQARRGGRPSAPNAG